MRLTHHSSYAIRLLTYCALQDNRLCRIADIARAYDISDNHLVKVAQRLALSGFLETVRGRNGGVRLAMPAQDINIARVIAATEDNLCIVECFDKTKSACPLTGACRFTGVLRDALQAFFGVLEAYTLHDFLEDPAHLSSLLNLSESQPDAA